MIVAALVNGKDAVDMIDAVDGRASIRFATHDAQSHPPTASSLTASVTLVLVVLDTDAAAVGRYFFGSCTGTHHASSGGGSGVAGTGFNLLDSAGCDGFGALATGAAAGCAGDVSGVFTVAAADGCELCTAAVGRPC
jgi:hypothetical protein